MDAFVALVEAAASGEAHALAARPEGGHDEAVVVVSRAMLRELAASLFQSNLTAQRLAKVARILRAELDRCVAARTGRAPRPMGSMFRNGDFCHVEGVVNRAWTRRVRAVAHDALERVEDEVASSSSTRPTESPSVLRRQPSVRDRTPLERAPESSESVAKRRRSRSPLSRHAESRSNSASSSPPSSPIAASSAAPLPPSSSIAPVPAPRPPSSLVSPVASSNRSSFAPGALPSSSASATSVALSHREHAPSHFTDGHRSFFRALEEVGTVSAHELAQQARRVGPVSLRPGAPALADTPDGFWSLAMPEE